MNTPTLEISPAAREAATKALNTLGCFSYLPPDCGAEAVDIIEREINAVINTNDKDKRITELVNECAELHAAHNAKVFECQQLRDACDVLANELIRLTDLVGMDDGVLIDRTMEAYNSLPHIKAKHDLSPTKS